MGEVTDFGMRLSASLRSHRGMTICVEGRIGALQKRMSGLFASPMARDELQTYVVEAVGVEEGQKGEEDRCFIWIRRRLSVKWSVGKNWCVKSDVGAHS
jgi:hypothetical protein